MNNLGNWSVVVTK